jgi:hypothetical protein
LRISCAAISSGTITKCFSSGKCALVRCTALSRRLSGRAQPRFPPQRCKSPPGQPSGA